MGWAMKDLGYWLTITLLERIWGIQKKTLEARSVRKREAENGTTEYSLSDAIDKTSGLISKRLNTSKDQAAEMNEAKNRKAQAELHKIELSNAINSGQAIAVADITEKIVQDVRSITDRLGAICSKCRMGVADMEPAHLAAVDRAIIEKRNAAAAHCRKIDNENQ